MRRLVLVEETDGRRVEHPVRSGMRLGRKGCELSLEGPGVSHHHAIIEHFGSGYAVRDLGSEGGTFVNDRRIDAEHMLEDGDRIGIGSVTLTVEAVEVEEAAAPPEQGHRGHVPPPEPVPDAVERRLPAAPGELPEFAAEAAHPRRARRSAATSGVATAVSFAIVLADAVAVVVYLA